MWKLKNKTNRNRVKDTENKLMIARWEEDPGLSEKDKGAKNYTLAVTK